MADEDWAPPEATPLAQVTAVSSPAVPTVEVPGYTHLTEVARGGDSIVYRAEQTSLGRDVAIKVIQVSEPAAVDRFERELAITVRLGRQHPHIVTVLDTTTTTAGQPCLVMNFHDLGSLHDRLRSHGPLPASEVVDAGTAVADALAFAHANGVLHRDVKPQNVLLLPTSYVLSDFGIARMADAGHTASVERFSYRHASPQVLDGMSPTIADDVWSLGSTLFTLLDGRAPFAADDPDDDTALAYLRRVRTGQRRALRRDDLPAGLQEVVEACLAAQPGDRVPTAERALAMLRSVRTEDRSWNPVASPEQAGGVATAAAAPAGAAEPPASPATGPQPTAEGDSPTRQRVTGPVAPSPAADSPVTGPAAAEPVAAASPPPAVPAPPAPSTPAEATPPTSPGSPARAAAPIAPSALAHLAPDPAPADADATGLAPAADGAATGGSPTDPAEAETTKPRSGGWRRVAAFVGGMLLAGAAVGIASALIRGGDTPAPPPPTETAAQVPTAADPVPDSTDPPQAQVSDEDLAAQNLVVVDQGTSAELSWVVPSGEVTFLSVVRVWEDAAPEAVAQLPATSTEYTVQGLDPDEVACFAVVGYRDGEDAVASGASTTECTG